MTLEKDDLIHVTNKKHEAFDLVAVVDIAFNVGCFAIIRGIHGDYQIRLTEADYVKCVHLSRLNS